MVDQPRQSLADSTLVRRWFIIFIAFGVLWRLLRFVMAFPVWTDEAILGLNVIDRSYGQLLQPLNYFQVAPFGFLWMLRFAFDWLGVSDYTARLPALLAGIGALLLFGRWAKLLISPPAAVLAIGVVAVSGYIVRHGVEMKPYAMDFLAALLLLLPATHYLISRRIVWLFALIAAVPLCSVISYPQVFIAGGIAVALWLSAIRENWTHRGLLILYCLILGVSCLAVLKICAQGQYRAAAEGMLPYWRGGFPPANPLKFVLWFLQIHTGNLLAYPAGGQNGGSLATAICFGIGLCSLWRKWRNPIRLMLLLPFLFTFIAAALRLYPYGESARISQHLAPVIILIAGAGMTVLIEAAPALHQQRRWLNIAASVLLGIGVVRLAGNIIWPYKTSADEQIRRTVRSLIATAGNDPIFLIHPEGQGPPALFWYLREQSRSYTHGMTPSADSLQEVPSAWVITCAAANSHRGVELARDAQMKWTLWSGPDRPTRSREDSPTCLEVGHLIR